MSLMRKILDLGNNTPTNEPDYEEEARVHLGIEGKPNVEKDDTRIVGRVIKVDPKGYGFISSKDIPYTRIFFHWTGLTQDTRNFADLEVGLHVEFEAMKVEGKGVRAIRIRVVDPSELPEGE